jgi:hypothetical protein
VWCNRSLSLGGKLTLVKLVLEAILVYWHALAYILIGIQRNIKKHCFKLLENGQKEKHALPCVNWKCIGQKSKLLEIGA